MNLKRAQFVAGGGISALIVLMLISQRHNLLLGLTINDVAAVVVCTLFGSWLFGTMMWIGISRYQALLRAEQQIVQTNNNVSADKSEANVGELICATTETRARFPELLRIARVVALGTIGKTIGTLAFILTPVWLAMLASWILQFDVAHEIRDLGWSVYIAGLVSVALWMVCSLLLPMVIAHTRNHSLIDSVVICADGIRVTKSLAVSQFIAWTNVERTIEDRTAFYFVFRGHVVAIALKRSFSSSRDTETVRQLLRKHHL
jgi:hypothetical protein